MMVPLPQRGQGCPTHASTPPVVEEVAEEVAAGATAGVEEVVESEVTSAVAFSAFGFFSFGALGLRSRFLVSFFSFSSAFAATAS